MSHRQGRHVTDQIGRPRPWRNRAWLYQEYVVLGKSAVEIAAENETTFQTIYEYLKHFDIQRHARKKAERKAEATPLERLNTIDEKVEWLLRKTCSGTSGIAGKERER